VEVDLGHSLEHLLQVHRLLLLSLDLWLGGSGLLLQGLSSLGLGFLVLAIIGWKFMSVLASPPLDDLFLDLLQALRPHRLYLLHVQVEHILILVVGLVEFLVELVTFLLIDVLIRL
jgi:hypothetical protein